METIRIDHGWKPFGAPDHICQANFRGTEFEKFGKILDFLPELATFLANSGGEIPSEQVLYFNVHAEILNHMLAFEHVNAHPEALPKPMYD
ncbi:MAG: hypothetical protein RJP95_04895 [Pirellulales bacterium]